MRIAAETPEEYLATLTPERREEIEKVREMVLRNLPAGYEESVNWGMLTYEIPLSRYPKTYNKQPLAPVGLAAQKNYFALYLMFGYGQPGEHAALKEAFARKGTKMDMGKSCLRFRKADDLPLDAIGDMIREVTPERYIEQYEAARRG